MEASNYRMTIVYPSASAARFDWDYYLRNHLPLAVGTSMRHCDITYCDCDKPVAPAQSPVACICVVHFADREALERFCTFFATSHAEAGDIIADEPNYTSITPYFVACATRKHSGITHAGGYRVRIMLPGTVPTAQSDAQAIANAMHAALHAREPGLALETGIAIGSIPLDAAPAYPMIWTATFAELDPANAFAAMLRQPGSAALWRAVQCDEAASALITTSEIVAFDLARAAPVRDRAR